MKIIILAAIIAFTSFPSFAQADTDKVEQYCEVVATPRLLSTKVTIDIDYGEERSIWRDNRLKTDNGKLKKFNTVIDALNYMGKDGWMENPLKLTPSYQTKLTPLLQSKLTPVRHFKLTPRKLLKD